MRHRRKVCAIIPALDEEQGIVPVLRDLPNWVDRVIVVDNGSTDGTAAAARQAGAHVVSEPRRGYGAACLCGLGEIGEADIVLFLDADYSDRPDLAGLLVDPVARGRADMVIGARGRDGREPGALTPQQRFGNGLACALIRVFWRVETTDLGPFRAISAAALDGLDMRDTGFGWTVEMQVKAARQGLRVIEVPVPYRRRTGRSKISGTLAGSLRAGSKILTVIARAALRDVLDGRRSVPTR